MRACPLCQVSLRRLGAWRCAIAALALPGTAAIAGLIGWEPPVSIGSMALDVVAVLLTPALAVSLWRVVAIDVARPTADA